MTSLVFIHVIFLFGWFGFRRSPHLSLTSVLVLAKLEGRTGGDRAKMGIKRLDWGSPGCTE